MTSRTTFESADRATTAQKKQGSDSAHVLAVLNAYELRAKRRTRLEEAVIKYKLGLAIGLREWPDPRATR